MTSKHEHYESEAVVADPCQKTVLRKTVAKNNLIACLIHLALFILFFPWIQNFFFMVVDFIRSETTQIIFTFAFIVMPLAAIYIYLGYCFLKPLPRLNFLSVFALPTIFLVINGLALFEAPAFSADAYCSTWQAFPFSHFAAIANISGYGVVTIFLLGSPNAIDNFWIHAVVAFISASFIPSLLMCLGICLNVLCHETKELDGGGRP